MRSPFLTFTALVCLAGTLFLIKYLGIGAVNPFTDDSDMPIVISGEEQEQLNMDLADGGLPPLPEVHNFQLLRVSRDRPDLAEGEGWTFAHHQDMAIWNGRLYAAWAMTPKDEDYPPYKLLYTSSVNGREWAPPRELFPTELSWALRFYFYRAANGRMLAFCSSRNASRLAMLVREITDDHQLGDIYTLIFPQEGLPPSYTTSDDQGFVEACLDALANRPLLEQSDYGSFLEERKMKWHDITPPFRGFYSFGKAFCFFHRADEKMVGISKMGFTTLSADGGETWSEPVLPPTLKTGAAKVWGQRTNDGKYILAYNPDDVKYLRYPLVVVSGDDGQHFHNMRVVHGENPRMRYPGMFKDIGPQYTRGAAEWANDGSFDPEAVWLIYSLHKEDIWLARVPLPLKTDVTEFPTDDFQEYVPGKDIPGWNIYSPQWAPVELVREPGNTSNICLQLQDGDPYDYARIKRLFPPSESVRVNLRVKPAQTNAQLEVELEDGFGRRPARLIFSNTGQLHAIGGDFSVSLGQYKANEWVEISMFCDQPNNIFSISVNDRVLAEIKLSEASTRPFRLLSIRTGSWRGNMIEDFRWNRDAVQSDSNRGPVEIGTDIPSEKPALFLVDDVSVYQPD